MLNITNQVEELHDIKVDDIPDWLLLSDKPMVLRGFASQWPLVQAALKSSQHACDLLRTYYKGTPVNTCYAEPDINGRVFYNEQVDGFNYRASKADLNLVLDKLLSHQQDEKPPTMYVGSTEVNSFLPGFKEQHQTSIDNYSPLTSLWIGNQSKIAAHYDFPLNLACCVVGKRRFTLFPPDQIDNLYVGPMEFAPGGQDISMVDFDNPDFDKYPKFKTAIKHALVAELNPGDALFLPSMWWHHVEGLEAINMLVTHWWRNTPAFMGRPNNALLMAMLSLRNLPKDQRKAWKSIFNHYIFEHDEQSNDHIPDDAKGMLKMPIDELTARKIRAELIEKLKR
ncbi:cupin-like domain-containing protein [Colwellia sp. 12G3]|uniref:cupin-like domain-containing protein n=1 Tax=Colwellia sp. 12G3 TaxID=2058299 RepID=UPI000C333067|nr:cupin-like domain-containing protein [Colwellia sp. 12G3]PKI17071.1 cupin [Colwellia sp. 12G3]